MHEYIIYDEDSGRPLQTHVDATDAAPEDVLAEVDSRLAEAKLGMVEKGRVALRGHPELKDLAKLLEKGAEEARDFGGGAGGPPSLPSFPDSTETIRRPETRVPRPE